MKKNTLLHLQAFVVWGLVAGLFMSATLIKAATNEEILAQDQVDEILVLPASQLFNELDEVKQLELLGELNEIIELDNLGKDLLELPLPAEERIITTVELVLATPRDLNNPFNPDDPIDNAFINGEVVAVAADQLNIDDGNAVADGGGNAGDPNNGDGDSGGDNGGDNGGDVGVNPNILNFQNFALQIDFVPPSNFNDVTGTSDFFSSHLTILLDSSSSARVLFNQPLGALPDAPSAGSELGDRSLLATMVDNQEVILPLRVQDQNFTVTLKALLSQNAMEVVSIVSGDNAAVPPINCASGTHTVGSLSAAFRLTMTPNTSTCGSATNSNDTGIMVNVNSSGSVGSQTYTLSPGRRSPFIFVSLDGASIGNFDQVLNSRGTTHTLVVRHGSPDDNPLNDDRTSQRLFSINFTLEDASKAVTINSVTEL